MLDKKFYKIEFGKKLRRLRLEYGLTQKELGLKLNIGETAITNYESGYSMPDKEKLETLSEIFHTGFEMFKMESLYVTFLREEAKKFVFEIDDKMKFDNKNSLHIKTYEQYDMKDFLLKFLNAEDFNFLSQSLLSKFDDFKSIKQIQKDMRVAVDYIFDYQPNCNPYHYYYNFMDCFANDSNLVKYTDKLEMITNQKIEFANNNYKKPSYDIYVVNSLHNLLYIFLREFVDYGGRPIRACQNCGKYFMVQNRKDELYCNNIFRDTEKTCRQLGAISTYMQKLEENPVLALYKNMLKRKYMKAKRNPENIDITKNFEIWQKQAKIEYEKYKNKEITAEEFGEWLSENDLK